MKLIRSLHLQAALPMVMGSLLCLPALAARSDGSALTAQYQAEVARCNSGQSSESRADCLREAGAALHDARQGQLGNDDAEQLERNRKARCAPLPETERNDCLARMSGHGSVSGSVGGGGVLRELRTRQVGDAPPVIVDPQSGSTADHSPR